MSSHISELDCPACNTPRMYADDCSATYGPMNPFVFHCPHCDAHWRYTDAGELRLVPVEES